MAVHERAVVNTVAVYAGYRRESGIGANVAILADDRRIVVVDNVARQREANDSVVEFLHRVGGRVKGAAAVIGVAIRAACHLRRRRCSR